MIQHRYLSALALGTLLWFGLFLAFTLIIDPYGVSPLQLSLAHINRFKPARVNIDRLIKPYEVWRYRPRTVFLGTSRIHQSIDPAVLDNTGYAPAYNASIPASSLGLNAAHLRDYIEYDPRLRTVIVELFLYNFLGQPQQHDSNGGSALLRNAAALFISADTLWASIRTVSYNLLRNRPSYEVKRLGYFYYPPGHNPQRAFDGFAEGIWKIHDTRSDGFKLHEPAFDSVAEIVDIARRHRLELIFVVTPSHAYDDYYLEAVNAWDSIAEWLRRVSVLGRVYSFAQPNGWVYERVGKEMRYWNDPFHFSLEFGRAMELSLAGVKPADAPGNFMLLMTPDKVAEHIDSRRQAIQRWARENPEFVTKFQAEQSKWQTTRSLQKTPAP